MIQGVLFDMDGILFDTERYYLAAESETGRSMGAPAELDYYKQFCGMNSQGINQILQRDLGPEFDVTAFWAASRQGMEALLEENGLIPMPHVKDTLKWLRANGYKTSVASSTKTERVQRFLAKAGFTGYFDAVVGGDQIKNGKPAPDIFEFAAKQLGLAPQACVAVEDSYNGIRSAHAAGCVTVMIPDMLAPDEEMRQKATILQDMSLLPGFIRQQNK